MKIAIAGGTGLAGRYVRTELERNGHEAEVMARSTGVDLVAGTGLSDALSGVEAVIDASNTPAVDPVEAIAFFEAATGNLLAAERAAGVGRHVLLSILGIDRVTGNAHYAGKRRQEELVRASEIPHSIVRATEFYEFPEMVVGWTRQGNVANVPPLLIQPVALCDVAQVLVEMATATQLTPAIEIAGPQPQDLVDMARRALAAHGEQVELVPSWAGPLSAEMAGDVRLPGPGARIMPTRFDEWLAEPAG